MKFRYHVEIILFLSIALFYRNAHALDMKALTGCMASLGDTFNFSKVKKLGEKDQAHLLDGQIVSGGDFYTFNDHGIYRCEVPKEDLFSYVSNWLRDTNKEINVLVNGGKRKDVIHTRKYSLKLGSKSSYSTTFQISKGGDLSLLSSRDFRIGRENVGKPINCIEAMTSETRAELIDGAKREITGAYAKYISRMPTEDIFKALVCLTYATDKSKADWEKLFNTKFSFDTEEQCLKGLKAELSKQFANHRLAAITTLNSCSKIKELTNAAGNEVEMFRLEGRGAASSKQKGKSLRSTQ